MSGDRELSRRRRRAQPLATGGLGQRFLTFLTSSEVASARDALGLASFDVESGGARGRVRGPAGELFETRVSFPPLPAPVFERAVRAMAVRASFAASLLAGRIPDDVETAFEVAGQGLLPAGPGDVDVSCACGEERRLCQHATAVLHRLAEHLDHDPFAIFLLRGRTREELLAALKRHRAAPLSPRHAEARPPVPREPLPEPGGKPEHFYGPALPLASLRLSFTPPEHTEAVLTRLEAPPLADPEAAELFVDLHRAIGQGAAERLEEWEWRRVTRR